MSELMSQSDKNPTDFAVSAGEDFELLFTTNDDTIPDIFRLDGLHVTKIGIITDKSSGIILHRADGTESKMVNRGYEHFTS